MISLAFAGELITVPPPYRILCVDDNRDAVDSLCVLLELFGFEARACYDGPTALALAGAFLPALCLIDLNMPGMDGDELARKLREQQTGQRMYLVAVTAQSDEQARQRIAAAGFDLHLVKPVDPVSLVAEVSRMLRLGQSLIDRLLGGGP